MKRGGDRIVTIDGPSGVGKSTVARQVAELLGFSCLDTGAMYRAVALKADTEDVSPHNPEGISQMLLETTVWFDRAGHVFLDREDVSELIRTEAISSLASELAQLGEVRDFLLGIQRRIGEQGGIVAEGRDMGTYVFPRAMYKFYLDATVEQRAKRRLLQSGRGGDSLSDVRSELLQRDSRDTLRTHSPLRPAPDALIIDTTEMSAEDVVSSIVLRAKNISALGG